MSRVAPDALPLLAQQARDPPAWIVFSCVLLLLFVGAAVVYIFRIVKAWIHGDLSTNWYVGLMGALWVFACACVAGMDYLSDYLPKSALAKLAENKPRLRTSPWVYGMMIGSVVSLLIIVNAVDLYQRYSGKKKTRKATYHLRRKGEDKKDGGV